MSTEINDETLTFDDLRHYGKTIVMDTRCPLEDASKVECLMRDEIFHSTLDWLSRAQFRRGAREAHQLLQDDRAFYDHYFAEMRRVFEEGRAANQQLEKEKSA